jgi:hypothetical protein
LDAPEPRTAKDGALEKARAAVYDDEGPLLLECELLFHGEYGVEARFLLDGELHIARTFVMKELREPTLLFPCTVTTVRDVVVDDTSICRELRHLDGLTIWAVSIRERSLAD